MMPDLKLTITIKFGEDGTARADAKIIDVPANVAPPIVPRQRLLPPPKRRRPWYWPTLLDAGVAALGFYGMIWLLS